MLESVLQNLINIGWAMLIFLAAYLANVAFSLWYNIKILHEAFDKDKLIASGLKILTFVVGLTLLCTAITTLPLFANQVGWAIPEEYSDLFADLRPTGSAGYKTALPREVADSIKKAYKMLENMWETYMNSGKINPVSGIFLGKNNFGYQDKTEYVLTPNTQQDNNYDADDIRSRYLIDSADSGSDSDSDGD